MIISDKLFHNLLSLIGIYGDRCKPCVKIISMFIIFLYHTSMIFYLVASCKFILYKNFKIGLTFLFLGLNSTFIWSTLFMKRKKILALILKMYYFRKQCNIRSASLFFDRLIITTMILVLFTLSEVQFLMATYDSKNVQEFWTLQLKISEGIPLIMFNIITGLLYFVGFSFPIVMTFIFSVMLSKCTEILQFYSKSLQTQILGTSNNELTKLFTDFLQMKKVVSEMIEVTNFTLLLIVVYSLFIIFASIYNIMQFKDAVTYAVLLDTLFSFLSGITILLMCSISSSMIPESLSEIRQIARERINEHVLSIVPSISKNALLCLRRIETEKIIYVSVYGLFRLTKSFILSATGMIFTYDLLIINTFLDPYNNTLSRK